MNRRPVIAVIGSAGVAPGSECYEAARLAGKLAVDHGYRIVTGGLGGVMEAASMGAHESNQYREGDTVGILPHDDPREANPWVDVVIATGMNHARNALVANADAVIAIGGGAGTLSEIAFAWTLRRLIVALETPGWAERLAGAPLDQRPRYPDIPDDQIFSAPTPGDAVTLINERLPQYTTWGRRFPVRQSAAGVG
ncbi:TIGR00725 family protein [Marinobacter sp. Arc7-DN-1]|uniref:TIGR00725 family protein n=1 Tax=Marinobacter sp. Arc7-DN-1 TaxID=2304594 RepID=UPI000E4536EF|nr:TIGR00725 family protein [Marinobacter sp. Arc7-DN-1]AXS84119.1 TIGR00725 family protein [Marinobacter sp. Arc7-DN-1]